MLRPNTSSALARLCNKRLINYCLEESNLRSCLDVDLVPDSCFLTMSRADAEVLATVAQAWIAAHPNQHFEHNLLTLPLSRPTDPDFDEIQRSGRKNVENWMVQQLLRVLLPHKLATPVVLGFLPITIITYLEVGNPNDIVTVAPPGGFLAIAAAVRQHYLLDETLFEGWLELLFQDLIEKIAASASNKVLFSTVSGVQAAEDPIVDGVLKNLERRQR
ncbi:hypothetical protein C8R47DRAFT_559839 [Mycena vitilis]|nr:hypothetical protein C8R47DRAFT_559839 [Mycena vitilis]